MVVKKKGLYLGLWLLLLCIGNLTAQGEYKFLFVNNTPYKIKFAVQYHESCKYDSKEVEHRRIGRLKSDKPCSIKKFTVVVHDKYIIPRKSTQEKNIQAETNKDEKLQRPEVVSSQSFAPGHFTRDKTIVVAVGEPKNLFKVRHWQITPTNDQELSEEEFIKVFPKRRFEFKEYISAFGWKEDPVVEE